MPTATLAEIRQAVRGEAGMSLSATTGAQGDAILTQRINTAQRHLATEYHWPELQIEQDLPIIAGDVIYAFPTHLGLNETMEVWVNYGADWQKVTYGIGLYERSSYGTNEVGWPIQRWEVKTTDVDDTQEIEVWPKPSQGGTLRFTGQKAVADMAADTDRSSIDYLVIAYYVAGLELAKRGKQDAEVMLSAARRRAETLIGRQLATAPKLVIGRPREQRPRPGIDYIPVTE